MIGVTPVGIITKTLAESKKFYREILGIERIQVVKPIQFDEMEGVLIRLESPELEVFSVETRLLDRALNKIIRRDFSLQYHPRNPAQFLQKLAKENIELRKDEKGKVAFSDLNGVNWEIYPEPSLRKN